MCIVPLLMVLYCECLYQKGSKGMSRGAPTTTKRNKEKHNKRYTMRMTFIVKTEKDAREFSTYMLLSIMLL